MFNYEFNQNFPFSPLCSVHSVVLNSGYLLKSDFSLTNSLKKDFQNDSQKILVVSKYYAQNTKPKSKVK